MSFCQVPVACKWRVAARARLSAHYCARRRFALGGKFGNLFCKKQWRASSDEYPSVALDAALMLTWAPERGLRHQRCRANVKV